MMRDDSEDEADFLTYAGIRFLSTAVLAPLENAKILQQVSYIPSDDFLEGRGLVAEATPAWRDRDGGRDSHGEHGSADDSDVRWSAPPNDNAE